MAATPENQTTLSEVTEFIYGDGAFEMLAKAESVAEQKRQKRQAQVGLASNVLGIASGAQALYAAEQDFKDKRRKLKGRPDKPKEPGKIGRLKAVKGVKNWAAKPKNALYVAGAAVGLQGANLAGDAVANRVLAREADEKVKKASPDGADLSTSGLKDPRKLVHDKDKQGLSLGKGQLVRVAINEGPKVKAGAKKAAVTTRSATKKVKHGICKRIDLGVRFDAEISKVDTDKRQVFGWASVVEKDGVPVVDRQGDYISADEIEKAAYEFVIKSRKGGNMHQRAGEEPLHVSDMIESFVVTPEKKQALGLPEEMPVGWWVGFKVNDDDTWGQIKDGKLKAFSVHGRGKRAEI